MGGDGIFQVFGEDILLVKEAFLSSDPSCQHKAVPLRRIRNNASNLKEDYIEFGAAKKVLESPNEYTSHFFFCTVPVSNSFGHMVNIPYGRSYKVIYYLIPSLVVVLCMSATFSGLNLAIMSFSINDLKLIQECDTDLKNRKRAQDILRLRRNSNLVLCTIVCGNCFCNTSITILINQLGDLLEFSDYYFVELLATGLLLIFTEILPALICTKNALKFASKMQYFVIFTICITLPISFPLSKILDRALGREDADDTPVEVDSMQLDNMREEGFDEFDNFNEKMCFVRKTLELRQKKAEDVMTKIDSVTTLDSKQPVTHAFLKRVHKEGHSRLPVVENDICGVLMIKDLLLLMDDEGRGLSTDLTAGTMLCVLEKRKRHCFVMNTLPIQQFMIELQQGCTMAIVVKYMGDETEEEDEEGEYEVIGIITLEDYMEEIVGEILDEKDKVNF
ncbi:unnamed protein product [Caenorhabditis sp. 36 PRJEB53466]|nr:unnamed protein product [Caenorhabditis sp. 36 PRJEB53466]